MGIIDSIKERVKGVVQSVTRRAQPKPSNEVRTYVTVKQHGDTTETITSDTPPKVPRESKIRERMERLTNYARGMVGSSEARQETSQKMFGKSKPKIVKDVTTSQTYQPVEGEGQTFYQKVQEQKSQKAAYGRSFPVKTISAYQPESTRYRGTQEKVKTRETPIANAIFGSAEKFESAIQRTKAAGSKAIGYAKAARGKAQQLNVAAGAAYRQFERVPGEIVSQSRKAVTFVKERVPANVIKSVQDVQKQPWQKDIGYAGFQTVKAFTGKNLAPYEKKGKRVKLGRKISKKEAKLLQKRYGANWRQAIKVDSNRGYFVQSTPREYAEVRRMNKLQSSQVNFGSEFPTPSVFISSEESRVPFARRSDDPFDVDANFMGDRGSGFTAQKKDPFAINGGSLMGGGGGNYDLGFNFGGKSKKSQTTRTGFSSGYDIKL